MAATILQGAQMKPAAGTTTGGGSTGAAGEEPAIRADRLTKAYGPIRAVQELSFTVPAGTVTGFVGPNGAGKTTTIRMLLGLVAPTGGTASVLGTPISRPAEYLPRVGALIEAPASYPTLGGRRNLQVLATLGGFPHARVDAALERVGLAGRAGDRVGGYSLGMKQRLGIAAALLDEPSLLVLDEPANGLDPAGILEIRALLRSLADDGSTVFVSSHLLAEIEQLADRLVLIKDGRLLFEGLLEELLARQRGTLVLAPERAEDLNRLARVVVACGYQVTVGPRRLRVDAPADAAAALNRAAMAAGITLAELSVTKPTLEATFMTMTQGAEDAARVP
jgi:ABC-2 type transport system ATP-binding protein